MDQCPICENKDLLVKQSCQRFNKVCSACGCAWNNNADYFSNRILYKGRELSKYEALWLILNDEGKFQSN